MRLAKFIREKRGTATQREFARKIGVAQSTIMRIENLDQNVTIDTLERLCRIFHTDVEGLFPEVTAPKVYPITDKGLGLMPERSVADKPGKNAPTKAGRKR
ncbi:MAG: helix-turn-helix transcriptional regulator [Pseudohongiellaceae bacterium]|nr:helix-turn-helix transcriptional regulator [Pseudohongiellaceae bacterium]